jgi:hypothetical protein
MKYAFLYLSLIGLYLGVESLFQLNSSMILSLAEMLSMRAKVEEFLAFLSSF